MIGRASLFILTCCVCMVLMCEGISWAQTVAEPEVRPEAKDGYFELTLKTPDSKKIIVDELVRDTDLDPRAFYRVGAGGYLAFSEADWVDKIEFKVYDRPVTEMSEYKEFAEILSTISDKIWKMNLEFRQYNQMAFRLMNMCDKSMFSSLRAIDDNVAQQLSIYKQFLLLRDLVVNSLGRFMRERSCVDRYARYRNELNRYTKQLTELCRDYDRLKKKAIDSARLKTAAEPGRPGESGPGAPK
ncbi:MAG: hypothetical protein LDL33_04235 [Desulfomonile sp.]|nr:hypothetical protein [Desulfomonile sp.]